MSDYAELFPITLEIRESKKNEESMPFGLPLSTGISYNTSTKKGSYISVSEIKEKIKDMKISVGKSLKDFSGMAVTYTNSQDSNFPYFKDFIRFNAGSGYISLSCFGLSGTPNTFKFFNLDIDEELHVYVLGSEFSVFVGNLREAFLHTFARVHGSPDGLSKVSQLVTVDSLKGIIESFKTGNFSVDNLDKTSSIFETLFDGFDTAGGLSFKSVLLNILLDGVMESGPSTPDDLISDFYMSLESVFSGFVETQTVIKWFMLGLSSYSDLMSATNTSKDKFLESVVLDGRDWITTLSGFGSLEGYSTSIALGGITKEFFFNMRKYCTGGSMDGSYLDDSMILSTMSDYMGDWDHLLARSIFDMMVYSDEDLIISESFLDGDTLEKAVNYGVMRVRKNKEFFNEDEDTLVDGIINTFYDTTFTTQYKERFSGAVEIADYDTKGDGLVLGNLSKMKLLSGKLLDKMIKGFPA